MSNWQYSTPYNLGQPGTAVPAGEMPLTFRDPLDARRAMVGFVPSADYPDGYLGTIRSRREDRLLDSLKNRLNQRSYQRGVHKGERVDPADYLWPTEFNPMTGIERQVTGMRAAPLLTLTEQLTAYGQSLPRGAGSLMQGQPPNPQHLADLRRLSPNWK